MAARNEIHRPAGGTSTLRVEQARYRGGCFPASEFITYPVGNPTSTASAPHLYSVSIKPFRGARERGRKRKRGWAKEGEEDSCATTKRLRGQNGNAWRDEERLIAPHDTILQKRKTEYPASKVREPPLSDLDQTWRVCTANKGNIGVACWTWSCLNISVST